MSNDVSRRDDDWVNGKAFARVLAKECVESKIKQCLLNEAPVHLDKDHCKNCLSNRYRSLKVSIRILDLRDPIYWIIMFIMCGVFLMAEVITVIVAHPQDSKLVNLQNSVLVLITVSCAFFIFLFIVSSLMDKNNIRLWYLPKWFQLSWLHTLPVIWLSFGLLFLNFLLVFETGWRSSPFLPAFLTAALTIISLPRENSRLILILTLIAGFLGIFACIQQPSMTKTELDLVLKAWGSGSTGNLPFFINMSTFVVSALLTYILRQFSFRIEDGNTG